MIHLEDFIATTPIYSTPMNTPGMGNISINPDGISTEPVCGTPKPTKRKKRTKRHIKDFL